MDTNFLYKQIQDTLIIPEHMKQEILMHFEKLSEKQLGVISELISAENKILLEFLKEERKRDNIEPSYIKQEYVKYRMKKERQLEKSESISKEKELENLLQSII